MPRFKFPSRWHSEAPLSSPPPSPPLSNLVHSHHYRLHFPLPHGLATAVRSPELLGSSPSFPSPPSLPSVAACLLAPTESSRGFLGPYRLGRFQGASKPDALGCDFCIFSPGIAVGFLERSHLWRVVGCRIRRDVGVVVFRSELVGEMTGVASSSPGSFAAAAASPPTRRLHGGFVVRDTLPYASAAPPPPPPQQVQATTGGGGSKISPAVLFIIVILAVVFFISGLLHLLVRLLMKKQHRRRAGSAAAARGAGEADAALQRQLQQLFHLHDAGLDQAFIDALPVFAYWEIVVGSCGDGDKEPFDCAVCLCEFDAEDRLRLLPLCGHAFHLHCIDTWLLSNSTCPLCRGVLFAPGFTGENNPMFDFEEGFEEGRLSEDCEDGLGLPGQKASDGVQTPVAEKRVFPVRLGKFKNVGTQGAVEGGNASGAVLRREEGESSSSSLDARRCFSMGTYQYVLGTSELRVALQPGQIRNGDGGAMRARPAGISSVNADIMEGKKICTRNKGESFSVSKIWQWSHLKGKLPAGSDDCSEAGSLPWMKRGGTGDTPNM